MRQGGCHRAPKARIHSYATLLCRDVAARPRRIDACSADETLALTLASGALASLSIQGEGLGGARVSCAMRHPRASTRWTVPGISCCGAMVA